MKISPKEWQCNLIEQYCPLEKGEKGGLRPYKINLKKQISSQIQQNLNIFGAGNLQKALGN